MWCHVWICGTFAKPSVDNMDSPEYLKVVGYGSVCGNFSYDSVLPLSCFYSRYQPKYVLPKIFLGEEYIKHHRGTLQEFEDKKNLN